MLDHVHTKLDEPLNFRKEVLNTALSTAEVLKSLECLDKIEEEKISVRERLQKSLKELGSGIDKFKKSIPPLPREFIKKQETVRKRSLQIKGSAKKPFVSEMSEEEKTQAERDIDEIRKRLAKL